MLDKAFKKRDIHGDLIFHSDQGWHYQHKRYQKALEDRHITQSMSRKGNCLDNAMMENFFGLMKNELLYFEAKRKEPGAIPSSIPIEGFLNNVKPSNFWGSHQEGPFFM